MALQIRNSFHQPEEVDKRLLAIDHFKDTILAEFLPSVLEFKDFSNYQNEHIKDNGKGYPILEEEYVNASKGNNGWAIAPLYYNNKPYMRNAMYMPKTCKLLKWMSHTSYAGITALNPGFGLDWHYDDDPNPDTLQIRCFYTLETCGGAYIEVQETEKRVVRKHFKDGEYMLFHSRKKHRVWNEGIVPRYSLVIDVYL